MTLKIEVDQSLSRLAQQLRKRQTGFGFFHTQSRRHFLNDALCKYYLCTFVSCVQRNCFNTHIVTSYEIGLLMSAICFANISPLGPCITTPRLGVPASRLVYTCSRLDNIWSSLFSVLLNCVCLCLFLSEGLTRTSYLAFSGTLVSYGREANVGRAQCDVKW